MVDSLPCEMCGHDFERKGRAKYCIPCRPKRQAQHKAQWKASEQGKQYREAEKARINAKRRRTQPGRCAGCGKFIPPKSDKGWKRRTYCSDACIKVHVLSEKICITCGTTGSQSPGSWQKYCPAEKCQAIRSETHLALAVKRQGRFRGTPAALADCTMCGVEYMRPTRKSRFCSKKCKRRAQDQHLVGSRKEFRMSYPQGSIGRIAIYDRDRWICQLCEEPVDRTLNYPDPWSASLDHILPLAEGGPHLDDNLQLAHLRCNLIKGARINDGQVFSLSAN